MSDQIRYFQHNGLSEPLVQAIKVPAKGASNLPEWFHNDALKLHYYGRSDEFVSVYTDHPRQIFCFPPGIIEILEITEPPKDVGVEGIRVGEDLLLYYGDLKDTPLFDAIRDNAKSFEFYGLTECDARGQPLPK